MATVTALTSARMLAIEAASVVSGSISGNDLILTKFDGSTVNAGNVRGATGPTGPDGNPIGTIIMGGWAAEPTNYKFLNGQTLTGGVATYATIATLFPSWVSGGNLILPNAMNGAVPLGSTGAGIVSGSMTHTLAANQMVPHTHTGPNHAHTGPNHQHAANHGHSNTFSIVDALHMHPETGTEWGNGILDKYPKQVGTSGSNHTWYGGGSLVQYQSVSTPATSYAYSGVGLTGSVTDNNFNTSFGGTGLTGYEGTGATGSTPAAGTQVSVDHTPKNITVKYAIKVL